MRSWISRISLWGPPVVIPERTSVMSPDMSTSVVPMPRYVELFTRKSPHHGHGRAAVGIDQGGALYDDITSHEMEYGARQLRRTTAVKAGPVHMPTASQVLPQLSHAMPSGAGIVAAQPSRAGLQRSLVHSIGLSFSSTSSQSTPSHRSGQTMVMHRIRSQSLSPSLTNTQISVGPGKSGSHAYVVSNARHPVTERAVASREQTACSSRRRGPERANRSEDSW